MAWVGFAQPAPPAFPPVPPAGAFEPDAQRTQRELSDLLRRYPPSLRSVLQYDPGLMTNQTYLATYPALAAFLSAHPEVARSPAYYVGMPEQQRPPDAEEGIAHVWENVFSDAEATVAGILAMSLIAYLIRMFMDTRRWARWTKVQTEAHTKLLDRFSGNEDLLRYINSPAGSKFLQSSPMLMEPAPRGNVTAPLSRILWSVQGGIVVIAVGIGLEIISQQNSYPVQKPLHSLGVLAMALGIGFVISAIISFGISHRLGLIEHKPARPNIPLDYPPEQGTAS